VKCCRHRHIRERKGSPGTGKTRLSILNACAGKIGLIAWQMHNIQAKGTGSTGTWIQTTEAIAGIPTSQRDLFRNLNFTV
jgi:hypothetical protein